MARGLQVGSVACTDWTVIPMTTKCFLLPFLFTQRSRRLPALLLIEFPELLEDESSDNQEGEEAKPSMDFALNGNNGNLEDD
jgi:hypothetical protein